MTQTRVVHLLEVVELVEQAYGPRAAWTMRVIAWSLLEKLITPDMFDDWLDELVEGGMHDGHPYVEHQVHGLGLVEAFNDARRG